MSSNRFQKTPTEVLDFRIDWGTRFLQSGETISSSSWAADSGITIDSETETTTAATVWVSGGTAGTTYTLTNTITTNAGRTVVRSIYIEVVTRR